jgi:hypothetical protein
MQFALFLYATHYAAKRDTAHVQKRDSIAEIYTLEKRHAIEVSATEVVIA